LCVITIKLNTLTDVPYQMTVGLVNNFDQFQRSRVYNAVRYNADFFW